MTDRVAAPLDIRAADLLALAAWASPAFPVGAFSYSHGLETAIANGAVGDAAALEAWVLDCVELGGGRNDAILLACAWRAARAGDDAALEELSALALALAPSAERRRETALPGAAFRRTTQAAGWTPGPEGPSQGECAYPVAFGAAAAGRGAPLLASALLFLQGFAANLVSVGVRLIPIGQTDGQRILAALSPAIEATARAAIEADKDAIGGAAFGADIAAMRHESLEVRLFRS